MPKAGKTAAVLPAFFCFLNSEEKIFKEPATITVGQKSGK